METKIQRIAKVPTCLQKPLHDLIATWPDAKWTIFRGPKRCIVAMKDDEDGPKGSAYCWIIRPDRAEEQSWGQSFDLVWNYGIYRRYFIAKING